MMKIAATLISAILLVCIFDKIESKRNKSSVVKPCQLEECKLSPQHYALYSSIKTAMESNFDISGKEILPLLNSIEILDRRFNRAELTAPLNGSEVVKSLLSNEKIVKLMLVLQSDQGRDLIEIYRSSVNGKDQNLACGKFRVENLERLSKKLESDEKLGVIFKKIHQNYLKKSAKKCLKCSCNSIDVNMSQVDSVLKKNRAAQLADVTTDDNYSKLLDRREFQSEELELCRFFKKSNKTDCELSGAEMKEFNISNTQNETHKIGEQLADLLKTYYLHKSNSSYSEENEKDASRMILAQCRPMRPLLDFHLAAIKWYRAQNLIEDHKLSSRTLWCPNLSYWLQVDRVCAELELVLGTSATFSYDVTSDKSPYTYNNSIESD